MTLKRRCVRRRGSAYVLVLAVTSLVGLIGLTALTAARLQHRGSQDRGDAVAAQHLADAALQLVHARLTANANWRTATPHDTWSTPEALGNGTVSFRLVDEADGDLTRGDGPVRVFTRATVGDAVRLVSVELRERFSPAVTSLGPELLNNGNMESGLWSYSQSPYNGARIDATGSNPHGPSAAMRVSGRSSNRAGPYQNLGYRLVAGETYVVDAWVRMEAGTETVRVGLFKVDTHNGLLNQQVIAAPVTTGWTHLTGQVVAAVQSGTLDELVWGIDTANNATAYVLDDVSFRRLIIDEPAATNLHVVRTTYRRELDG